MRDAFVDAAREAGELTPEGVPVEMISPGSSVTIREMNSITAASVWEALLGVLPVAAGATDQRSGGS